MLTRMKEPRFTMTLLVAQFAIMWEAVYLLLSIAYAGKYQALADIAILARLKVFRTKVWATTKVGPRGTHGDLIRVDEEFDGPSSKNLDIELRSAEPTDLGTLDITLIGFLPNSRSNRLRVRDHLMVRWCRHLRQRTSQDFIRSQPLAKLKLGRSCCQQASQHESSSSFLLSWVPVYVPGHQLWIQLPLS